MPKSKRFGRSTPAVVTASAFSIDENSANHTVVGTVVANDLDGGDTLWYAITAGNTNGAFEIETRPARSGWPMVTLWITNPIRSSR